MDRHRARIRRLEEKEDLIDKIKEISGVEPPGVRHLLNLLAQPDVLDMTIGFFDGAKSMKHTCQIFADPWDCILEDEAKNDTIRGIGWMEDVPLEALREEWCEPCRKKALMNLS